MADKDVKYFRLTDDIRFPDRWYLGDVKNVDNWALVSGGRPPEAASELAVELYRAGRQMDFTLTEAYGVPVVSAKMRRALGDLPGVCFHDAGVEGATDDFSVMLIESTVECVDEERSEFEQFTADDPVRPDLAGQFKAFFRLVLDKAKAKAAGRPLFRLARFEVAIIINEEVKTAIEGAGITGVLMREV